MSFGGYPLWRARVFSTSHRCCHCSISTRPTPSNSSSTLWTALPCATWCGSCMNTRGTSFQVNLFFLQIRISLLIWLSDCNDSTANHGSAVCPHHRMCSHRWCPPPHPTHARGSRITPAHARARSAHDRNNRFQHEYLHALFNKDTSLTAPHHELQVRDVGVAFSNPSIS